MTLSILAHPLRRARVLGACLTLASVTAMAQQPPGPGPDGMPAGPLGRAGMRAAEGPMGHGPGGPMLHGRQLDLVGATPEQKAKIREIYQAAHAEMAKQHEAQRDLHRQMAQLMAAPTVDAAGAEALRQKISAGRDAASKRMLQAMLDAGAVLTPEQRQKMAEHMAKRRDMAERHRRERRELDGPRG